MHDARGRRLLLIISRNLPPVVGGIERLMHRLIRELATSRPCVVIGPRGCRRFLPPDLEVFELPHRPAPLFVALAWCVCAFLLWRRRFAAVLAGNGLMRFAAAAAWPHRMPIVTMVYGLDIVADNRLYQCLCLPLIARSAAVIACSSNSARLAREHGIPAARLHVVTPGVDPAPTAAADPAMLTGDEAPLLVSVGRLVRRKGIAEFIRKALPSIIAQHPRVEFVIVGEAPAAALKREQPETERISSAIADAGVQGHARLAGYLDDRELARLMARARVHVFPVIDLPQDVEGFGLVALEAAASGVPTVAFDTGGVGDAVEHGVSGTLVKPEDYPAFAEAVCELLGCGPLARREACVAYARSRSWERYGAEIGAIIDRASDRRAAPRSPPG
jgi:phosphatidylinositol alpha-1,6-mannosyltransferase